MLRGIFFDLDDTLIASTDAQNYAMEETANLAQTYYPEVTKSRLLEAMISSYHQNYGFGTPGYKTLATLPSAELRYSLTELSLQHLELPTDPTIVTALTRCYTQSESHRLRSYPDVVVTLSELKPYYLLGIITNGPSYLQREKLNLLNLTRWFDIIVVDSEFGSPKPDPNLFAYAGSMAQLQKEELVFVGNAIDADVLGANSAGWSSIYLGTLPSRDATYTIAHISDILQIPSIKENLALASRTNLADTI